MILTSLDHTPGLLPDFDPAFAWLRTVANNPPPAGKVNIDGDRLFAIVEDKTADTVKNTPLVWETHRRYADIQYVARGVESHGWLNISHAPPTQTPYNDTQDAQFYEAPNASQHPAWFDVSAGHLAVYHP
ncbi:MAG: YhcH/YjgK/YiaL family protein, partial [Algisphaera sp.]